MSSSGGSRSYAVESANGQGPPRKAHRKNGSQIKFPLDFMDLDEFFSESSLKGYSSNGEGSDVSSQTSHLISSVLRLQEKRHKKSPNGGPNGAHNSIHNSKHNGTHSPKDEKIMRALVDKKLIAEMNKAYDHNVCLDRFIMQMGSDSKNGKSSHNTNKGKATLTHPTKDRDSVSSLPNSSSSSNCSCADKGQQFCKRCSPETPPSTEEDVRSNKSDNLSSETSDLGGSVESNQSAQNPNSFNGSDEKKKTKIYKPSQTITITVDPDQGFGSGSSSEIARSSNVDVNMNGNVETENTGKRYKGGKVGRKRKRGYIYDPKPVIKKSMKKAIPDAEKDSEYWERRKRNNEAARKSREYRRSKEMEMQTRLEALQKENSSLKTAIELLIKRNEYLDSVLSIYSEPDNMRTTKEMHPPNSSIHSKKEKVPVIVATS